MLSRIGHEWLFRDADGRTRTERPMFSPPTSDLDTRIVRIVDPVGGYQYVLDTVNKVAHRVKNAPPGVRSPTVREFERTMKNVIELSEGSFHFETLATVLRGFPPPVISTAELGSEWIDGVFASGFQTTSTYAASSLRPHQPVVVTTEAWVSDARKVVILSKRNDPVNGSWQTRMTDYHAGEPDPALFRVPEGYSVVDQTGKFTLDIAQPVRNTNR